MAVRGDAGGRPTDGTRRGPYEFVNQHALTCWFSTPSTVAFMPAACACCALGGFGLRWSLFCGEAHLKTLAQQWMSTAAHAVVENLYGPTEATIAITGFRLPADLSDLPDIMPIGGGFADRNHRR